MSLVGEKTKVFGNLAALKTLSGGIPKLKTNNGLPSVNNDGNVVLFLTDVIKSLVGFESLLEVVSETIANSVPLMEKAVKASLKAELKTIVNCGTDPTIPEWFKSTGAGLKLKVSMLDFMGITRIDPASLEGGLIFSDVTQPLTDSSDFDTFLVGVIQDEGVTYSWKGIASFTFHQNDYPENNVLIVRTHQDYDNKPLTTFNNDFVNSITLFEPHQIMSGILDILYGSISSSVGKTVTQLENEAKLNSIVTKLTNDVQNTSVDDSFFSFDNSELAEIQKEAAFRKAGGMGNSLANKYLTKITTSEVSDTSDSIRGAITVQAKKDAVSASVARLSEGFGSNLSDKSDANTLKLNFIQSIIDTLAKAVVSKILSPKVVILFAINNKIIYNVTPEYSDGLDFIKKNRKLIKTLIGVIIDELVKVLLKVALKEITALVAESVIRRQKEKNVQKLAQIQSLVGVPSDIIQMLLTQLR